MPLMETPAYGPFENGNAGGRADPFQNMFCIEAPVVYDQLQMRESVTRNIVLSPSLENSRPVFTLKGASHFRIEDLRALKKIPVQSEKKQVDLLVGIRYDLIYSDGEKDLVQQDDAYFVLSIDKIKCPDGNVKRFEKNHAGKYSPAICNRKSYFFAEALAQAFGEVICSETGALILDLGAFFIIKSISVMQVLVPSVLDMPCRQQNAVSRDAANGKGGFYSGSFEESQD